jgi:hypothetical protein
LSPDFSPTLSEEFNKILEAAKRSINLHRFSIWKYET